MAFGRNSHEFRYTNRDGPDVGVQTVQNPFLIGSTIYLRPLERDDAARLVPWVNDNEITRQLLLYRPMNLKDEQDFIDRLTGSEDQIALGIVARDEDRLIGVCGLHRLDWRNRHAAFGIFIGVQDAWGKGHGAEATRLVVEYAFKTLNLQRVWLHVNEDNSRAIRCYEKVGFQREGLLRREHYRDGRYGNTVVMGILCDEWQTVAS
jgi:RimJ/RimL family protein N-acetyltransferase